MPTDHMPDCKCFNCRDTQPMPDRRIEIDTDELRAWFEQPRTYRSSRWQKFLIWAGLAIMAGTLAGCSTKQVADAATKPTCMRGQHVVTEPARTDKRGRQHERARYCEQDTEPMEQVLTDAATYSRKNCAAIDNAENRAGWIIDGQVTLARYTDYGDNLGYEPTPSKRARPVVRQAELAIQAGKRTEKFEVVCI